MHHREKQEKNEQTKIEENPKEDEGDTPPTWFTKYMENYRISKLKENDTPPTWFLEYMENYKEEIATRLNHSLGLPWILSRPITRTSPQPIGTPRNHADTQPPYPQW